jgi:hypothetical protein
MIKSMHLTDHEVTIATTALSSTVAVAAVIWGYRGVRSANRNALEIAREQRSSQREDELRAIKRMMYAKALADLASLIPLSLEQRAFLNEKVIPRDRAKLAAKQWGDAVQRAILSGAAAAWPVSGVAGRVGGPLGELAVSGRAGPAPGGQS